MGQAAISVCLAAGCQVFTTVGSPEKRRFLLERFSGLKDDHIGNSRDASFEQLVLRKTRGRGVDLVLNSLAEDKLQASVRCLTEGGRFLEIGKVDLSNNSNLGKFLLKLKKKKHSQVCLLCRYGSVFEKYDIPWGVARRVDSTWI